MCGDHKVPQAPGAHGVGPGGEHKRQEQGQDDKHVGEAQHGTAPQGRQQQVKFAL